MKSLVVLLVIYAGAFSSTGFAEEGEPVEAKNEWKIDLVFNRIGDIRSRNYLGEACGKVSGPKGEVSGAQLRLLVDYESSVQGHYNVPLFADGRFCAIVRTFYGRLQASVLKKGKETGKEELALQGYRVQIQ